MSNSFSFRWPISGVALKTIIVLSAMIITHNIQTQRPSNWNHKGPVFNIQRMQTKCKKLLNVIISFKTGCVAGYHLDYEIILVKLI